MSWNRLTLPAILLIPILFFLFFHERLLSGHDPANFVLMLRYGFDVAAGRPHAPGYPGFYVLWSMLRAITGLSEHGVILAGNLGFTLIAISLAYWAASRLFDTRTAVLTALLIATNPLTLYYSSVSEIYAYDAAFSAFVLILLLIPLRRYELLLYFLYGLLGGFRLSSVMLTFPVVAGVLFYHTTRDRDWEPFLWKLGMIALGTLCWLVPFAIQLGGLDRWFTILHDSTTFAGSFAQNNGIFIPYTVWMLNIALLLLLLNIKKISGAIRKYDTRYTTLLALIVVPGLFFVLFCYSKGYALLYIAPLMMLLARLMLRMKHRQIISAAAIAANLAIVFAVPFKAPNDRSALSHAHRTSSERWESAALRGTSFFSPTLAHLQTSDAKMQAALDLLRPLPAGTYVVLDNAAALYAYPRSLQAAYPQLCFLMAQMDDSSHLLYYHGDSMNYEFQYSKAAPLPLYYLTTKQMLDEIGPPDGDVIGSTDQIVLFRIHPGVQIPFFHKLKTYFSQGAAQ